MPRDISIRTGSSTFVDYAYEPTYRGSLPSGTTRSLFGKDQKVNGLEFSNNQMAVAQLYRPTYESYLYNKNTGGCSVEYILSNPFMFSSVFSNPEQSDSDDTQYIWSAWENGTNRNTLNRDIRSMNVRFGIERFGTGGNDFLQTATGVMCNSLSLKTAIDQPVTVSQNLTWSYEEKTEDAELPTDIPTDSDFTPYNFVHGEVTYMPNSGSAVTVGTIQDIDLAIATDAEHLWEVGSETAVDAWRKIFKMTGKVNLAFINQYYYDLVISREGQGDSAGLVLLFRREQNSPNQIRIELDGVSLLSRRVTYAPGEPVFEDFDYQARECVVTANTTVDDFTPVQP